MTGYRILGSFAVAALLAVGAGLQGGVAASAQARAAQGEGAGDGGFCRRPAAQPMLPPEVADQQRQQQDRDTARGEYSGRDRVLASPVAAPPPPPAASVAPSGAIESGAAAPAAVAVTGSRMERGAPMSVPSPDLRRPGPPRQPAPQSGMLTAGEHDDLLNPELYAAYVGRSNLGQHVRAVPHVDTRRVLTVRVVDARGQAVPFADVVVTCSDGNQLTLATQADGTAVYFPGMDRLSPTISVAAMKGQSVIAPARKALVSDEPGGQTVGLTARIAATAPTKLDLMFVVDTTGSMGDEIRYLQSELRSIIRGVSERHRRLDIRLGFVFYRDTSDDYVTRTVAFDRDIGRMQGELARERASGGGNYPEAMDQALIRAVGQDWRDDAVKSLFLIADAPPHNDRFARSWAAAEAARAKRIHLNAIAASGVADSAEYILRAMAAATQARYLFLTDDSGIGNPHAPPAVDCYLVTRLDQLVRRVIDAQISGRRVEPEDQDIIRSVGQYDRGKCILPADFQVSAR